MKLLVFAGSTRLNSWNRKLATVTVSMARASGAEVTHLELADFDVPMYNADLEARGTPADVMKLKQITYEHPAWIICTPEYNASYPALLKNTLDWISSPVKSDPVWNDDFRSTRGKVVGVLSASPGALGGLRSQSHLVPLLLNLHCWVAPQTYALGRAGSAVELLAREPCERHVVACLQGEAVRRVGSGGGQGATDLAGNTSSEELTVTVNAPAEQAGPSPPRDPHCHASPARSRFPSYCSIPCAAPCCESARFCRACRSAPAHRSRVRSGSTRKRTQPSPARTTATRRV